MEILLNLRHIKGKAQMTEFNKWQEKENKITVKEYYYLFSGVKSLWSKCLCPPVIHMLKPNLQSNDIGRWSDWDVIRSQGGGAS